MTAIDVAQPFRDVATVRLTALEFDTIKPEEVIASAKVLLVDTFGLDGMLRAIEDGLIRPEEIGTYRSYASPDRPLP